VKNRRDHFAISRCHLEPARQDNQDLNSNGTTLASRVETFGSGRPCSARKQVKEQRNHGKNEQQVNQESGDVEKHKPASPKNQEKYR
jgi:hypothetical protein